MWKPPLLSLSCDNWRNEFPSRFHSLKCRQIPQMITYYSCTSRELSIFIFAVTCISLKFLLFFYFGILHQCYLLLMFPLPFFSPFGSLLHFSRLSLIKYFTWNSISHCMGIPSKLPKGPLMGPYRDLGRIPINGAWNIMWSILIILLPFQDPVPDH